MRSFLMMDSLAQARKSKVFLAFVAASMTVTIVGVYDRSFSLPGKKTEKNLTVIFFVGLM